MKLKLALALISSFIIFETQAQRDKPDVEKAKKGDLTIQPVNHATLFLKHLDQTIYVDPTGGAKAFEGIPSPSIIVITDIHGDHLDLKTIEAINKGNIVFIVPQAVADKLPASINKQQIIVLNNSDKTIQNGIAIQAIPMYNLPETADSRHPKGRGNGYVLTIGKKNIYISGDTEDIPEMRKLKKIDYAFVCMNLPFTMDINQASQGVLAFKPKVVYPYHHRGQDINAFKTLVNSGNPTIEVRIKNWYPAAQ